MNFIFKIPKFQSQKLKTELTICKKKQELNNVGTILLLRDLTSIFNNWFCY